MRTYIRLRFSDLRTRHDPPGHLPCLEDFRTGAAWREADEGDTDIGTMVEDLLTGQYAQPLQVVAFNPVERCSRFKEIAEELDPRISAEGREVSEGCSVPRDRPLPVSPLRF
jgi:hypothetical protein